MEAWKLGSMETGKQGNRKIEKQKKNRKIGKQRNMETGNRKTETRPD